MSTLLAIGDSVIWGQGLAHEHKTASIMARHLGVELKMLAHAGAKIGIRDSYTVTMPSGEVPCFFPTIVQQLQGFMGGHSSDSHSSGGHFSSGLSSSDHSSDSLSAESHSSGEAAVGDPADVQWVLMNGGINDVEVQRVFNPMIPLFELELHTRNYCGRDLLTLLRRVVHKFPNAQVLVLGYYPALSQLSQPRGIEAIYSLVHGARFTPLFDAGIFHTALVEHCVRFWKLSTGLMRAAVEQVNRAAGERRAVFVDCGMDETNAAYAPQSLVWELDLNDPDKAPDEVAVERMAACELVAPGEMQKHQCLLSAAGHPNVAGAARMAARCMAALSMWNVAQTGR